MANHHHQRLHKQCVNDERPFVQKHLFAQLIRRCLASIWFRDGPLDIWEGVGQFVLRKIFFLAQDAPRFFFSATQDFFSCPFVLQEFFFRLKVVLDFFFLVFAQPHLKYLMVRPLNIFNYILWDRNWQVEQPTTKMVALFFLIQEKLGSVGSVPQQINLVWPNYLAKKPNIEIFSLFK